MTEIKASVQINAAVDKVWNIVSDLDKESKFWNNITKTRTLSTENNVVKYEITIGKVDRCLQTVILYPKEKILAEFTKGMIGGTKTTTLTPRDNGTFLEIIWNIKFKGMAGFMSGKPNSDFQNNTEQAVLAIKQTSEGNTPQSSFTMETRTHWADKFDSDKK
ncbi:MAG: SRPBCC family protein [Thaumarchaeota archaeon]|nr:SRPBCC family protein [Nitrososphaerota archaeon]